jgi:hypothetical protein
MSDHPDISGFNPIGPPWDNSCDKVRDARVLADCTVTD